MPLVIAQSICKFNYKIIENYPISLGVNIHLYSYIVFKFHTLENSVPNTILLFFIFILIEINMKLWSHDDDDIINFNSIYNVSLFIHSFMKVSNMDYISRIKTKRKYYKKYKERKSHMNKKILYLSCTRWIRFSILILPSFNIMIIKSLLKGYAWNPYPLFHHSNNKKPTLLNLSNYIID